MPIKAENLDRYPENWHEIRAAILDRAGQRCENPACRVGNGWIGYRDEGGYFVKLADAGRPSDAGLSRFRMAESSVSCAPRRPC